MPDTMTINGKHYPLWQQFVERKEEWIGGLLHDMQDGIDNTETITDITLTANGKDSAFFSIEAETFGAGFDVHYGGISGRQPSSGWLRFNGYGGHEFEIQKRGER